MHPMVRAAESTVAMSFREGSRELQRRLAVTHSIGANPVSPARRASRPSLDPALVLRCDLCKARVDHVQSAKLVWHVDENTREAKTLRLGHPASALGESSRACGGYPGCPYEVELYWLADERAALHHLCELVLQFEWSAEDLQMLALVASVVPRVADEGARRLARTVHLGTLDGWLRSYRLQDYAPKEQRRKPKQEQRREGAGED